MKRIVLLSLVVAVMLVLAMPASAENPTFFGNREQCVAALMSGEYTPYAVRGKWRGKKVEGVVINPIEAAACIDGEVVGGRQWVVVRAGFRLLWDAAGKPVAMEDCGGNPVYDIAYAPVTSPTTLPSLTPAKAECCPSITREDLLDAADRIAAAMPVIPEPPKLEVPRRRVWPWVVGGVATAVTLYAASRFGGGGPNGPNPKTGEPKD